MAERSSPLDIDLVVDLHTNAATAADAAQAILNATSSTGPNDAGLNLKYPMLYPTTSESEDDDDQLQGNQSGSGNCPSRTSSPPPNCAICLGRCKNKCYTKSCMHQFCFKCLCEWSKVKAECPLCKQPFRSIIHNVKSSDQFDEYLVQQPTVQIPHTPLEVTYPLQSGLILNGSRRHYLNVSMRSWQSNYRMLPGSRGRPVSMHEYDYMSPHDVRRNGIPPGSFAVNAIVRRTQLLNLYRQELPEDISNSLSAEQLWRRYIYDRKLYAMPVSDITGRFRECSARFYRANPGQRVRLVPFANRDIIILLRSTNHDVTTVLETLNEGLEASNILSRSFRRRLQPFLGDKTVHFIHELSNFARSPYDMIGYDRAVEYAPQQPVNEDNIIEFSSSEEEANNNSSNNNANHNDMRNRNDSINDAVTNALRRNAVRRFGQHMGSTSRSRGASGSEFRVQSRSASSHSPGYISPPLSLLSFTITTTSEGSEAPGVSVAVSAGGRGHAQVAAINLSTHNRAHNEVVIDLDDIVEGNGGGVGGNDGAGDQANMNSNNDGDGNSANGGNAGHNDSAVVSSVGDVPNAPVGSPQIVASIALSTSSSDECEFVLERKPPHLRTPEMVSLNSETDSDVVFIEETKPILAEATYSTSENDEHPMLARLIAEQEQQDMQPSTSTGLRSRTLRQIVASKRQNTNQRPELSPNKRRKVRPRHMKLPPSQQHSSESTTSDEDDDSDEEYVEKRSGRGRTRTRRSATKHRTNKRTQKKRQRSNGLPEAEQPDYDGNETTNEQKTKSKRYKRESRRTTKKESVHIPKTEAHTSDANEDSFNDGTSSEEDDKENLKALQLRLKTSLSDVEANMEQDGYSHSPAYSSHMVHEDMERDIIRSPIQNNNELANDTNSGEPQLQEAATSSNTETVPFNQYAVSLQCSNEAARTPTPDSLINQPSTSAGSHTIAIATSTSAATAATTMTSTLATSEATNAPERRASYEESSASYQTGYFPCSIVQQDAVSQSTLRFDSISPASFSAVSMDAYVPQHSLGNEAQARMFLTSSPSLLSSNSSMESYQLPSTSQQQQQQQQHQRPPQHSTLAIVEPTTTTAPTTTTTTSTHLKYSDSSDTSTSTSSSESSDYSSSNDDNDSDGHNIA